MAHIREIHDDTGDLVDLVYFCSDSCNRGYHPNGIVAQGVEPYGGWYGCQEVEYAVECGGCGEVIEGYLEDEGIGHARLTGQENYDHENQHQPPLENPMDLEK